MLRRWILLVGVASAVFAAGCNDFNTTIGTPTNSSTISFVSPSGANAGSQGLTLSVNGSSFLSNSVVEWNNSPRVTTFLSTTQLLAQITTADLATTGTVSILVNTPGTAQSDPQTGINIIATSNVITFVIQAPSAPLPVITSISPTSATGGNVSTSQSSTLTITGTGFIPAVTMGASQTTGSIVYWNGSPVVMYATSVPNPCVPSSTTTTSVTSATSLTVMVSGCLLQTAETARITVFNPPTGSPATGGGSSNTWLYAVGGAGNNARKEVTALDGGSAANSLSPAISTDTRYVAFVAPVPDPSIDASTGTDNVYVRDTCSGAAVGCTPATTLISVAADGISAADGASETPSMSADGRYVTFVSLADNLVAGGASGLGDIFVRDTCTGAPAGCTPATMLISVAADGSFENGASDSPSISAGGRYVVFSSVATNLVAGTTSSGAPAIYLRDLCVGAPAGCQVSTIQLSVSSVAAASSP